MQLPNHPVDYRGFRLSRLTEPRFSHLLLLLDWVGYLIFYGLTENLIAPERCHSMHCILDDLTPFCEIFIIPYCLWFLLIVGSLLYFVLYDVDSFRRMQIFIMITQIVAMAIYIIWPSRQDLRPEVMPRQNVLTALTAFIYSVDTPTGVCPSLHVAYSVGIASVWVKYKPADRWFKAFIVILAVTICFSTAFVKQHSYVDIFAAIPLSLFAEALVYGRDYWWPRLKSAGGKDRK